MNPISLMRLDNYLLSLLNISIRPSAISAAAGSVKRDVREEDVEFSFSHSLRRHNAEPRFWVTLQIRATWPSNSRARFESISIGLDGFFSFPKDTPDAEISKYVPVLCLTNLIGVARGILSQATASCPGGSYILPLLDANQILRAEEATVQTAEPVTSVKPSARRAPRRVVHKGDRLTKGI